MKTKQMIKTKRQNSKIKQDNMKKTKKIRLKRRQTNKTIVKEDNSEKQFKKLNCSPKDKNDVK